MMSLLLCPESRGVVPHSEIQVVTLMAEILAYWVCLKPSCPSPVILGVLYKVGADQVTIMA